MEYFLFNILNALSSIIDVHSFSSLIHEWIGEYDRVFVDLVLSDVIAYAIYFVIIGFIISFIFRFFIGCLRKVFEVFTK